MPQVQSSMLRYLPRCMLPQQVVEQLSLRRQIAVPIVEEQRIIRRQLVEQFFLADAGNVDESTHDFPPLPAGGSIDNRPD